MRQHSRQIRKLLSITEIQICQITKLVTPLFRMDIHIDIITATTATFSYAVNVFHNHLLCP